MRRTSDHRPVRNHGILRDANDAVAHVVKWMVEVVRLSRRRNHHVVTDARVLVYNGVLDACVLPDADAGSSRLSAARIDSCVS